MVKVLDDIWGSLPTHVLAGLRGLALRVDEDLPTHLDRSITGAGLRGSHGALLGSIPDAGARPSELADVLGITKQAVGQRLGELVEHGWVVTKPDPSDARAVLVTRTPEGTRLRRRTEAAIHAMEADWARQVGDDRYRTFQEVLAELGAEAIRRRG